MECGKPMTWSAGKGASRPSAEGPARRGQSKDPILRGKGKGEDARKRSKAPQRVKWPTAGRTDSPDPVQHCEDNDETTDSLQTQLELAANEVKFWKNQRVSVKATKKAEEAVETLNGIKEQIKESRPLSVRIQDYATKLREAELRLEARDKEAKEAKQAVEVAEAKAEEARAAVAAVSATLKELEEAKRSAELGAHSPPKGPHEDFAVKIQQAVKQGLSPVQIMKVVQTLGPDLGEAPKSKEDHKEEAPVAKEAADPEQMDVDPDLGRKANEGDGTEKQEYSPNRR